MRRCRVRRADAVHQETVSLSTITGMRLRFGASRETGYRGGSYVALAHSALPSRAPALIRLAAGAFPSMPPAFRSLADRSSTTDYRSEQAAIASAIASRSRSST
jgi:hypothetical protein